MTEKVAKYISESDNESALFQSPEKMKENVDNPLITAGVSGDSGDEYGTASEDEESDDDYSDEDETNSDDDEDREGDENEESVTLDAERQSGDGQEQDAEAKKKVDDDEDRSNPQYIPKKGTFYEHDDRTAEDVDAEVEEIIDDDPSEVIPGTGSGGGGGPGKEKEKKDGRITKKWQASQDRWTHDRFDEGEQAPKSRSELVSSYGYDIRNEDGPPRARRRRRYGRGPSKYTRNWEDESAYTKPVATSIQKKPRPEDFPALGSEPQLHQQSQQMQQRPHNKSHRRERQSSSEYKENNDRNIERNERHQQQQQRRESFKDYKSSSSSSNRRSDRQKPDRDRRNDGDRSRGSFRQNQVSGMDNRNRSNEIPSRENQRYESRQSYEQEVNYNRSRYQGHSQQQQQVHESQIVDGYQKNNNVVERNRIPVNQRLQGQEIIQHVQHMQQQQQPPPPSQSQMMRQEMMQQQQQQQQKQTQVQMQGPPPNVALNDANRTKRYSIQRQRQGMDVPVPVQQAVPPQPPPQMVVQQQGGQITVQDHNQIEAALLQQLQSEKIKQMHSTLGHQKQISYQQTIGNQSSPQNSQMSIPTAQQQQQQYQTQAAAAAYYSQNAEYAQPGAPQNQAPAQMLAASTQNAAVAAAAAAAPQYPQYAYIQSQQAPPPHIQAQSFPAVPQTAPQYAAQPAYATGYQPAAAAYGNPAPQQAAAPAPAPIYQSQPPPNITHYFAQPAPAHQAPPANPPQRVTRRPTNAIPILAPPDRKEVTDVKGPDATKQNADSAAENIDHILDNMFVRRPPIQASNLMKGGSGDPNVVAESVKGLSIKDDNKDDSDKNQSTMPDQVG